MLVSGTGVGGAGVFCDFSPCTVQARETIMGGGCGLISSFTTV